MRPLEDAWFVYFNMFMYYITTEQASNTIKSFYQKLFIIFEKSIFHNNILIIFKN